MIKYIILMALMSAAQGWPLGTPLLAKLVPQPNTPPAHTEHAGYVEALTPAANAAPIAISTSALMPSAITTIHHHYLHHLPYTYAAKYVTYSTPAELARYHITY